MDSSNRTLLIGLVVALVVILILSYAYRGSHVTETTTLPSAPKDTTSQPAPREPLTPPAQPQPTPAPTPTP